MPGPVGPFSALFAVQKQVYATLTGDAELAGMLTDPALNGGAVRIFDEVPASVDIFPYILLGEATETINDTFGETGRTVLVNLHIFSQARGWLEVQQLANELGRLLHQTLLPSPTGWTVWRNDYTLGQEMRDPDGTRHLLARYTVELEHAGKL